MFAKLADKAKMLSCKLHNKKHINIILYATRIFIDLGVQTYNESIFNIKWLLVYLAIISKAQAVSLMTSLFRQGRSLSWLRPAQGYSLQDLHNYQKLLSYFINFFLFQF